MESKELHNSYYRYLRYFLAKDETTATAYDKYMALAYAVRGELTDNWINTQKLYNSKNVRRVYFLSTEYIFGKSLHHNIINLGIEQPIDRAVRALGFSLSELYEQEDDFELGNSGRGRIAACLMESMATLSIPAMGYGIRYDYGRFQQSITNGIQAEKPYDWLHRGHPWEIIRPEYTNVIHFGGNCAPVKSEDKLGAYIWNSEEMVYAVPYDVPIQGYGNNVVNTLRMWSARASEEFLPDYVNHGDYVRACEEKSQTSRITKILFPDEDVRRSNDIRMKQLYFFISASLQDILRRYKIYNPDILDFDKKVAIHLCGSGCAFAIPELMRLLVDVEKVEWNKAWQITTNVFSFSTTLMSRENMENWPVYKVTQMFPRHMQIIFDINQIHLDKIRNNITTDVEILRDLSLIEEGDVKRIKLTDLAMLGSCCVTASSKLHKEVLTTKIYPNHTKIFPDKFKSITAGVNHRRWLLCINKELASLISESIGTSWTKQAEELKNLEHFINERSFIQKFIDIKLKTKEKISTFIEEKEGYRVDPFVMFDMQIGKIHSYKRQVLHLFYIIDEYLRIKSGERVITPRVHIFSGKASPSDALAKQIVFLINIIASVINKDDDVSKYLKVIFIPNFNMSNSELLVPGADLYENLASPLVEAGGTFNLKFAFNGSIIIGSKNGITIELAEQVGDSSVYLFGKSFHELIALQNYNPHELTESNLRIKRIFNYVEEILPSFPNGHTILPLIASLRDSDRFFVILDFEDYIRQQERISEAYNDQWKWAQQCILAIAKSGNFTSDRAALEYSKSIWKVSQL
ncbi:MAG: glycogen/starch/alpha-glucan family phosphorylase [Chitinispirillaceae bacterium]|nr:glycogen/starch/alpha-glucan family phosphorylase [Chitinispirillaceae bacterium]